MCWCWALEGSTLIRDARAELGGSTSTASEIMGQENTLNTHEAGTREEPCRSVCASNRSREQEMWRAWGCRQAWAVLPVPCPAPFFPWHKAPSTKPSFWGQRKFYLSS